VPFNVTRTFAGSDVPTTVDRTANAESTAMFVPFDDDVDPSPVEVAGLVLESEPHDAAVHSARAKRKRSRMSVRHATPRGPSPEGD